MNYQFKPGDLALTLARIPGHIDMGVCVEVRRILGVGDDYRMTDGMKVSARINVMVTREGCHYLYGPHELMPLGGDLLPADRKSKAAPL